VNKLAGSEFSRISRRHIPVAMLCLSIYATNAFAYVGPGLAGGAVASILGILAGIALLIVGVVWYPIKMLINKLRKRRDK